MTKETITGSEIESENSDVYRDLLYAAISFATEAHWSAADPINKDGTPYILHPLRLMMQADTYAAKIVAVLHDTLEDTPLQRSTLEYYGFTPLILGAIDALTKRPEEMDDYEAFIERVALNPLATRVKLLDLYDNIDVTRLPELGEWELQRTAKYHRAILRLRQVQRAVDKEKG